MGVRRATLQSENAGNDAGTGGGLGIPHARGVTGDRVHGPRRPAGSSQTVGQKKATLECLIIVDLTQAQNYSLAPAKPTVICGF